MTIGSRLPVPVAAPDDVRRAAHRILAGRQFHVGDDRTLVQRARDWVLDHLDRFLTTAFSGRGGTLLAWAVVAVLAAVAMILVVRLTRGTARDPGVAVPVATAPRRSAADWRADAETHEREGEWRLALRCRYRALVADLAARGLVEEVPGRTAGEYRRVIAAAVPDEAEAVDEATGLFEAAWYGNLPTGPDEAARFRVLAEEVVA